MKRNKFVAACAAVIAALPLAHILPAKASSLSDKYYNVHIVYDIPIDSHRLYGFAGQFKGCERIEFVFQGADGQRIDLDETTMYRWNHVLTGNRGQYGVSATIRPPQGAVTCSIAHYYVKRMLIHREWFAEHVAQPYRRTLIPA